MKQILAIVKRNITNYVRNKGKIFGGLIMAVFMLVMFSFLMKSSMDMFSAPMEYLISGIIIMTVFQTSINNSSEILEDIAKGYMKEVMVAPLKRSQISIGNILSGALIATLQGSVTTIVGLFLGLHVSIMQVVLMLVVMMIIREELLF